MAQKKTKKVEFDPTEKNTSDAAQTSAILNIAEDAVKKRFGDGAIIYLSDFVEKERDVVSTGSLVLDKALGVGGLTKGKMVEVFGTPGSGKTTIALSTAVEAQRANPEERVLYIDVEKSFNKKLAVSMGMDVSRTAIVDLVTAEENLEAAEVLIKTGKFGICIVDSIASLTPRVEYEADLSDQQMGLHARLMSKLCRNIKPVIASTNTLLILINQIRSNIGGYGAQTTTTGGKAIPFYADVRIEVSGGSAKSSHIKSSEGEVLGHVMKFVVVKNKLSAPFVEGETSLIYGRGFDRFGELIDLSEALGIAKRGGAWYTYENDRFQGRESFRKALVENSELEAKLAHDIKKVLHNE